MDRDGKKKNKARLPWKTLHRNTYETDDDLSTVASVVLEMMDRRREMEEGGGGGVCFNNHSPVNTNLQHSTRHTIGFTLL